VPDRTAGGLFLPDPEALAMQPGEAPPFATPIEPPAEGLVLDAGFASPYFITDPENWWAELDRPRVHFFDHEVVVDELIAPLEAAAEKAEAVLVVAPSLSAPARAFMVINKLRGIIFASAIETTRADELRAHLGGKDVARRVRSGRATTTVTAA
jgi:hypothetical protein